MVKITMQNRGAQHFPECAKVECQVRYEDEVGHRFLDRAMTEKWSQNLFRPRLRVEPVILLLHIWENVVPPGFVSRF